MGNIKIKHRAPKRTEFTPSDIVIDVKNGSLFYKSDQDVFQLTGINITDPLSAVGLTPGKTENKEILFNDNGILEGISSFKFLSATTTLDIEANLHIKNDLTFKPSFNTNAGAGTQVVGITLGAEDIGESSSTPGSFFGGALVLKNSFGKLRIGPRNEHFCHFYTDRDKYYFDHKVCINGSLSSYDEDLILMVRLFDETRSNIRLGNTPAGGQPFAEVNGNLVVNALGNAPGKILADGDIIPSASDERLKENIVKISNPLDKIQQVRGIYFDWNQKSKEEGFKAAREKNEIGMIAQEVEQIVPQAIEPAPFNNKYKTIKYDRLIPLLVECIKEQQKQIDELKSLYKS